MAPALGKDGDDEGEDAEEEAVAPALSANFRHAAASGDVDEAGEGCEEEASEAKPSAAQPKGAKALESRFDGGATQGNDSLAVRDSLAEQVATDSSPIAADRDDESLSVHELDDDEPPAEAKPTDDQPKAATWAKVEDDEDAEQAEVAPAEAL